MGTLTKDHTYVGYNAHDTFIVTDAANGEWTNWRD